MFTKIFLRFAAARDAKGAYGKTLAEWVAACAEIRKKGERVDPLEFPVSAYMGRRVKKYRRERIRVVKRFRKDSRKVYAILCSQYSRYTALSVEYNAMRQENQAYISQVETEAAKATLAYIEKEKYFNQANQTDTLTPEMGGGNLHTLHGQVEKLKDAQATLERKRSNVIEECGRREQEHQLTMEYCKPLIAKSLMRYENRLILFRNTAELLECGCDEALAYYLYVK
ncbi:MAG: hypothetical protein FWG31_02750 [Oscillospiraceae bacterium]|nr:hypothetical protein [Oscillospiraceae bacterium]